MTGLCTGIDSVQCESNILRYQWTHLHWSCKWKGQSVLHCHYNYLRPGNKHAVMTQVYRLNNLSHLCLCTTWQRARQGSPQGNPHIWHSYWGSLSSPSSMWWCNCYISCALRARIEDVLYGGEVHFHLQLAIIFTGRSFIVTLWTIMQHNWTWKGSLHSVLFHAFFLACELKNTYSYSAKAN